MNKGFIIKSTVVSVIMAWASVSLAQNTENIAVLPSIEVHGYNTLPTNTWKRTYSKNDIQTQGLNSLTDIGALDSSVNYNPRNASINIRGLDANRVNTTIDDIPIPWLSDGARNVKGGLNTVDMNILSAVDIDKGTASGAVSSGLGGSINLQTINPSTLLTPGKSVGALVKTDFDSRDNSIGTQAAIALALSNRTKALLQYGYRQGQEFSNKADIGGEGATRTQADPTRYHQQNFLLKLDQELDDEQRLEAGAETFNRNTNIDSLSSLSTTYTDYKTKEIRNRQRYWLSYDYSTQQENPLNKAKLTTFYTQTALNNAQDAFRKPDTRGFRPGYAAYLYPFGDYYRNNSIEQKTYGLNGELGGVLQLGTTHEWSAGAAYSQGKTLQYSQGIDNCADAPSIRAAIMGPLSCSLLHTNQADQPDAKFKDWSVWMADKVNLNQQRSLSLTPVLRVEGYSRNPQQNGRFDRNPNASITEKLPSQSKTFLLPSLALAWNINNETTLNARYAFGMRAPTAAELYNQYGAPGLYLVKGNPNLKAETSKGIELGAQYQKDKKKIYINFFDNHYKNFIESNVADQSTASLTQVYPLGVTTSTNRNRVRIYGIELGGQWQFNSGVYTGAQLTYTRGRDQETHDAINSVTPLKSLLTLGYANDVFDAQARWSLAAKRDKVSSNSTAPKLPGYGTLDLSANWKIWQLKGLSVQAGIYNLFDKKYWLVDSFDSGNGRSSARPLDYYSEAGRNYRLNIRYQF